MEIHLELICLRNVPGCFTITLSKGLPARVGRKKPVKITLVCRGIIKARMFRLIMIVFVIVIDLDRPRSCIVSHYLVHRHGGGFFCRLAHRRCGSVILRLSCSVVWRVWLCCENAEIIDWSATIACTSDSGEDECSLLTVSGGLTWITSSGFSFPAILRESE